jgi:xylulose-5-phosphate/fructose-6-phosphate phosphoketolase
LENIDQDLAASMEWALAEISRIQTAARSGNPIVKPRWPVLILRTPKGWSGPKMLHGEFIEGSFHSHQVPLPGAKTSKEELQCLQEWLQSYGPHELFATKGGEGVEGAPAKELLSIVPDKKEKKLGCRKEAYAAFEPIQVPEWVRLGVQKGSQASCMKVVGTLLRDTIKAYVFQLQVWALLTIL